MALKFKLKYRRKTRKRSRKVSKPVRRFVKRQLNRNIETKYVTKQLYTPIVVTSLENVQTLNNIAQGATDGNRIGDMITFKRLFFKYTIVKGTAVQNDYNFIRVIIFQYKQINTVPPNMTTILNGSAPTYISPYNWDNRFNYCILYDKIHNLNNDRPAITVKSRAFTKWAKKRIQFHNGTSNTYTNGLYLMLVSDDTDPVNGPTFVGEFVFQYQDA